MCGRARCTLRADDIPRACRRANGPTRTVDMDRYHPSYNVSPGWNFPVLRRDHDGGGDQGYAIHCMKWGLIPSFTKKTEKPDFYRMFNARSESLGEKASFRRLLPKCRCLVAVEGFYEWKKDGSKKQPYYIHFKDDRSLVFAALYDSWQNSEGEMLYTFTIVTTSASSALEWLHDRMPVILGDKEAIDTWLNDSSASKFNTVLKPYEDSDLVWYPVTPAMGKTSFNGPECIKQITLKTEDKSTISKFFSRKENREERETKLGESGGCEKSDNADLSKNVKEECDTGDKLDGSSVTKIQCSVSTIACQGELMSTIKRDSEELLTDSKLDTGENDNLYPSPAKKKANLQTSPARKKANLKGGDDKQPTLLSFFGKK